MFDTDGFIEDCLAAYAQDKTHKAIREVAARAVAAPGEMIAALGEPTAAGVARLYHAPDLTILNVAWAPYMTLKPHNHNMWAVIAMYSGREDNIFWRREDGRISAAGAKELCVGDAEPLGRDIIHSVTNPAPRLNGALHIYGGDFFNEPRSEWDPEDLTERRYDVDANMRLFQEFNDRFAGMAD